MNRIARWMLAAVVVASSGLFVLCVHEAAACPSEDSVLWETVITADTADDGFFDITEAPGTEIPEGAGLSWSFRETPFIGIVEAYSSTGQGNIEILSQGPPITYNVTYTPSYFFPTSCTGSIDITIDGNLSIPSQDGELKSTVIVSDSGNPPPYAADIHTLTIYHD